MMTWLCNRKVLFVCLFVTTNRADISFVNDVDDDFVEEPVMMIDFTGSLKEMSKFVLKAVLVACNGNS